MSGVGIHKSGSDKKPEPSILGQGASEMKFSRMEKFRNYFRTHSRLTFLPLLTNRSKKKRIEDAKDSLHDWRTTIRNSIEYRKLYRNAAFLCEAANAIRPRNKSPESPIKALALKAAAIHEVTETISTLILYSNDEQAKKTADMVVGKMIEHGHDGHLQSLMGEFLYNMLFMQKLSRSFDEAGYLKLSGKASEIAALIGAPTLMNGADEAVVADVESYSKELRDEKNQYRIQKSIIEPEVCLKRAERLRDMILFQKERIAEAKKTEAAGVKGKTSSITGHVTVHDSDSFEYIEFHK